jgi:hypothetical protein
LTGNPIGIAKFGGRDVVGEVALFIALAVRQLMPLSGAMPHLCFALRPYLVSYPFCTVADGWLVALLLQR